MVFTRPQRGLQVALVVLEIIGADVLLQLSIIDWMVIDLMARLNASPALSQ
ncbi:hypothetical protein ABID62_006290 [Bradyrhizobium sp. S3.9.1]|uniref:hypothetical protein n=1 Tax=Bradyrhizobium sp. 604_D8_N2_3 TaxID=3240370 RepID=UPI00346F3CA6